MMKRSKRIISIITAALCMVTMSAAAAFAEELDTSAQEQDSVAADQNLDQVSEGSDDVEEVEGEDLDNTGTNYTVSVEVGDSSATLSWANIEGETADTYTFEGIDGITPTVAVGDAVTTATIKGLTNDTAYTVTVKKGDGTAVGSVTFTPVAPLTLSTLSGNSCVKLVWNGTEGTEYVIERSIKGEDNYSVIENPEITYEKGEASYIDNDIDKYDYKKDGVKIYMFRSYSYRVSVKDVPATTSKVVSDSPVRSAYDKVRTRTSKTLYSHDGKNKKLKLSSGQVLQTYGYNGGKFEFYYNPSTKEFADRRVDSLKGYYFFTIARINTKSQSIGYTKSWNYSKEEAEFYINSSRGKTSRTSKTKYLIWVNEYTQRLYLFHGEYQNWELVGNWDVSTGKSSTPTPNGITKTIQRKVRYRHSIPFWSPYQTWNSLHGVRSNWASKLGTPQSAGCIRNTNSHAKILYYKCKKGTRLRVY